MKALLPALLLLAVVGCSDAVDPTLGTAQAFSVYGYLDPSADRQAVRVVPIVEALGADSAGALAATVTSVERETGRTATWRDSVVTFEDGSSGHVFVADYTPTGGSTVEITVRETEGAERTATVEVAVPAIARPAIGAVRATGTDVVYEIGVPAPRVLSTTLVYHVLGWPTAPEDTVALRFPGTPPLEDAGGGTWAVELPFVQVSRAFLTSLREASGPQLELVEVELEAFVANAAWAVPRGGFDLDRIVEPGTFTNVTDGFGFVGAGYRTSVRWEPSLITQSRSGFRVDEDPAASLFLNEVSADGWVEIYNPTREAIPLGGYTVADGDNVAEVPFAILEPGAFGVVPLPGPIEGLSVRLVSPRGETALQLDFLVLPSAELGSYGAYPDGRSRVIGELPAWRGFDLFRGMTLPTPGAPNRMASLAAVNEVFAAGAGGWAEAAARPGFQTVFLASDVELPIPRWIPVEIADGFAVADEAPGRLDLPLLGGEVAVVVWLRDTPPRVHDVRTYGPQGPKTSAGLLPEFDLTSWRDGLLPTRGAPNAAARFASR